MGEHEGREANSAARATARIFASNAFMLVPDFLGLRFVVIAIPIRMLENGQRLQNKLHFSNRSFADNKKFCQHLNLSY